MMPAPIAAVALAAALAIAASPAVAQSYEETINFIVTGNPATSEVSFGNEWTTLTTSRITAYNANECTFDMEIAAEGMGLGLSLWLMDPTPSGEADTSEQQTEQPYQSGSPIAASKVRYNLNAVTSWRIDPLETQYGRHAYEMTLDGTGKVIGVWDTTIRDTKQPEWACTAKCPLDFPPDTDLDRFSKAMDYLYSEYCTGSYSAF